VLFLWQIPHFLAIALYRFDDYQRAGFEVLPVTIGPDRSRALIAPFSIALVAVSLVLAPLHVAGTVYSAAAIVLGASFVLLGLGGVRRAAGPRWARSVFLGSLAYLTLLFAALIIDHLVA